MKKQKYPYLLHSKWTAQEPTFGWRHFQVANRKNQGSIVFAEMVSSCDPGVRFWINAKTLQDKRLWHAGWKSLAEQEELLLTARM
ncbi:MAG TPA: TIGR02450 family Trp-rich protein [Stenomitos sp.]